MWTLVIWFSILLATVVSQVVTIEKDVGRIGEDNLPPDDGQTYSKEVLTEHGLVRGFEMEGTDIIKFLDILYGAFGDENLFQEPIEPPKWATAREITEHISICPQIHDDNFIGTKDCLTLSVFAPKNASNLDVLFHIHDAELTTSGDPEVYGPQYLVPEGIILVLPNYRLGALGFLCLQNETAPGNAALKDLTLALKWISENIEAFGGNATRVTVSGSGFGGVLAGYLMLSPLSKDYITRVITESGSSISHWGLDRDPISTAMTFIERLEKIENDRESRSDFFKDTDLQTIITASTGLDFRPCVGKGPGAFLNSTPFTLFQERDIDKDIMIGSANQAGMYKTMMHTEETLSQLNEDFVRLLPNDLYFKHNEVQWATARRVKRQYFGNLDISMDNVEELSLCYTDYSYLSPALRAARLLVLAGATVYFYEFSYPTRVARDQAINIHGAARGESMKYVFCGDGCPVENDDDRKMVAVMTDLWVNFIKTGKPSANGIEWNQLKDVQETDEEWLSIGTDVKPNSGVHTDRLHLWTEIYDEYFVEHSAAVGITPFYPFLTIPALLGLSFVKI